MPLRFPPNAPGLVTYITCISRPRSEKRVLNFTRVVLELHVLRDRYRYHDQRHLSNRPKHQVGQATTTVQFHEAILFGIPIFRRSRENDDHEYLLYKCM
ncbi:unnamed protein product [Amoebophrya sp. A120]|nr:unnamed protein product [Amoebophrya sp. A120]|eukprot:GSA120T00014190001.1